MHSMDLESYNIEACMISPDQKNDDKTSKNDIQEKINLNYIKDLIVKMKMKINEHEDSLIYVK